MNKTEASKRLTSMLQSFERGWWISSWLLTLALNSRPYLTCPFMLHHHPRWKPPSQPPCSLSLAPLPLNVPRIPLSGSFISFSLGELFQDHSFNRALCLRNCYICVCATVSLLHGRWAFPMSSSRCSTSSPKQPKYNYYTSSPFSHPWFPILFNSNSKHLVTLDPPVRGDLLLLLYN